jgi:hypothetical protein
VTLTCAAAGVTGAIATVAVEKTAAAARDVIAIRFNMTCLHACAAEMAAPEDNYAHHPLCVSSCLKEFRRLFRRFSVTLRFRDERITQTRIPTTPNPRMAAPLTVC